MTATSDEEMLQLAAKVADATLDALREAVTGDPCDRIDFLCQYDQRNNAGVIMTCRLICAFRLAQPLPIIHKEDYFRCEKELLSLLRAIKCLLREDGIDAFL